jgi:hypothetical protein
MKDTDFFLKLNIPNFPEMQKEILDYLKKYPDLIPTDVSAETFVHIPLSEFPIAYSVFSPRAKNKVYETSICVVPPNFSTTIHVDGLSDDSDYFYRDQMSKIVLDHPDTSFHDIDWKKIPVASQFVLIIPISNYENSMNYWYDVTNKKDKEIIHYNERPQFPYKWWLNFYTDPDTAIPIEQVLIDKPTFIKSNIYHNIKNYGTVNRLVLIVRIFEYEPYSSLDQVFDYTGLL